MERVKNEWNYVMQCGLCPDRDVCPYRDRVKDETYCIFEAELYDQFMNSLDKNYNLIHAHKLLAEQVVWNLIIAQRISRRLKLDGLQQDIKVNSDGQTVVFKKEHILKQGLHLDLTRIIRMLKELKQTPKESTPKEEKHIYEFKDAFNKFGKEMEEVVKRKRKKRKNT